MRYVHKEEGKKEMIIGRIKGGKFFASKNDIRGTVDLKEYDKLTIAKKNFNKRLKEAGYRKSKAKCCMTCAFHTKEVFDDPIVCNKLKSKHYTIGYVDPMGICNNWEAL